MCHQCARCHNSFKSSETNLEEIVEGGRVEFVKVLTVDT